ncbi:hypothetical protein BCR32DRAFT_326198 [Anaeromyces robustus]|uniref:Transglutaminase-like domain-containing protein n=1 Tax=Anaeromyces robustus TaxID=1754192 RepID=A0A1Y1XDH8_9FUNG|nr:hypothetical protein BCR32DRAFT_326198 [Anaeromyces robustus]|eukprot:ORX83841.1 hypothetical protein BCR32DRAFT_326198 [Anaeromyces robustus]
MKLYNIILFFIINIIFVLANDDEEYVVTTDVFDILVRDYDDFVTILGFNQKMVKAKQSVVTIPQFINFQGEKFEVGYIDDYAFYNDANIKSVNFPDHYDFIEVGKYSFANCKNLKTVNIEGDIFPDITSFLRTHVDVTFTGKGIPFFVDCLCRNLLSKWKLPINQRNLSAQEKKVYLYELAKKLRSFITYTTNEDSGNTAVALATRRCACGGFSRSYYNLALKMGIPSNEILVGGDSHCHAWNYAKVNGKWYNVDVTNFSPNQFPSYSENFFYSNSRYSAYLLNYMSKDEVHKHPERWVVVLDRYHYKNEASTEHPVDNFDTYLKNNKLGTRA